MRLIASLAAALLCAAPAAADEISDSLQSAIDAYAVGDVQYALEELDYARTKLLEMKTDALGEWLPEAPAGWTREVNTEANAGMAMMGGGVGAEADYASAAGEIYRVQLFADNPIVASMSVMITNAGAMGMKTDRIGRQKFAIQDNQTMGLIANRILVQIDGPDEATRKILLEAMDFEGMANFGG